MAGPSNSHGNSKPWTNRLLILIAFLLIWIIIQNTNNVHQNGTKQQELSADISQTITTSFLPDSVSTTALSPDPLPSIRVTSDSNDKLMRMRQYGATKYGGKGDKQHLGGFTDRDEQGLSYNAFNYMLGPLAIKSVLDLGCGKGFSTMEFLNRGAKVLCVEGSHDAIEQTLLPADRVIEHDFTRGPWWPDETYDATWSVEFFEHVSRPYILNYLPILRKSALLFVSSSGFGGWHHVEIHDQKWWRSRLEAQGFVYSDYITNEIREYAKAGRQSKFDSQHVVHGMQVFINPEVAKLPKHHHLFGGWGCHDDTINNRRGGKKCTGVDVLPAQYTPLLDCHLNKSKAELQIWNCVKTATGERIINPETRYYG